MVGVACHVGVVKEGVACGRRYGDKVCIHLACGQEPLPQVVLFFFLFNIKVKVANSPPPP